MKYGMTDKEMNELRYAETAMPRKQHLMADLGAKLQRDLREARRALELADRALSRCGTSDDHGKFRLAFKKVMGKDASS